MRISIFVDGANIFYMQKNQLKWWIDMIKLLTFIKTKGEIVDATYYIGVDAPPDAKDQKYLDFLANNGYALETKDLKTILQDDGSTIQKANLDIEIVLDMFNTIDNYDMAILISGDGDFERPIKLLKARGKKFLVMSTKGTISKELRTAVGMHYIDFQDIKDKVAKQ